MGVIAEYYNSFRINSVGTTRSNAESVSLQLMAQKPPRPQAEQIQYLQGKVAEAHLWPLQSQLANNWVMWAINSSMTAVKISSDEGWMARGDKSGIGNSCSSGPGKLAPQLTSYQGNCTIQNPIVRGHFQAIPTMSIWVGSEHGAPNARQRTVAPDSCSWKAQLWQRNRK